MKYQCARCTGHVDMESYYGQTIQCPHCGIASQFLLLQPAAPTAVPSPAPARGAVPPAAGKPGQGPVVGGWVCFALAVIVAAIPFPTFYIYGPLALVAFILGIVAIAQKRLGQGLGILLCSLIGVPLCVLIIWALGLIGFAEATKKVAKDRAAERARTNEQATARPAKSIPAPESRPARVTKRHTTTPRTQEPAMAAEPVEVVASPVVAQPDPIPAAPVVDERKIAADKAAFKFHTVQAQAGNVGSMVRLAHLYMDGTGVETNTRQAKFWLQKAADAGDTDASTELINFPK